MYCDPVSCICLTAKNTYVVIAACLRSLLEYQVSGLCICLSDYICLLPLVRGSVSYCCLHCLILVAIDHCPGYKATAVQAVCTDSTCTLAAFCGNLLSCTPTWVSANLCGLTAPEISYLTYQRVGCGDYIYTFLGHIIPNALTYKALGCSNYCTEKLTVCLHIFFQNLTVILGNFIFLNIVIDLTVAVCNMGNVLLVPDNRVHLCKNLRQVILAGCIQGKFCFACLALLIDVDCQNILPVSHQKAVCRCADSGSGQIAGI